MKNICRAVGITAALFYASCEIDPYIEDGCGNLPDLNELGYITVRDSVMYYAPFFNPNNENEFVYIEWNESDGINKLFTYNMSNGAKTYLTDNVDLYPQWNSKNWIVFNRYTTQIWKIKSNGDSLTMLFNTGTNLNLVISPDGQKIAFKNQIDNDIKIIISDINGQVLDSIDSYSFYAGSWSKDNLKISGTKSGEPYTLGYFDSSLQIFHALVDNENGETWDRITDTEWFNDSKRILWLASGKFHITDIESGTTSTFYEPCENNYNLLPSISPNSSNIIWENTKSKVLDNGNTLSIKSTIILTDIYGNNEIKILPLD